jgi:hypothetical protein
VSLIVRILGVARGGYVISRESIEQCCSAFQPASDLSAGLAMSIDKELAASFTGIAQNIRPHAVHSQSEARDLVVGKGAQGGPLVFPNDTRIAQDSLFRVTHLKRSNRKISGIRFPFR